MSIANTDQAERWNSGEDMAHWINNQARPLEPVWLVQAVAPA